MALLATLCAATACQKSQGAVGDGGADGDTDTDTDSDSDTDTDADTDSIIDWVTIPGGSFMIGSDDEDGDVDVMGVSYEGGQAAWWENEGDNATWTMHLLNADYNSASSAMAADIDGDGDLDILGASYSGKRITW